MEEFAVISFTWKDIKMLAGDYGEAWCEKVLIEIEEELSKHMMNEGVEFIKTKLEEYKK